MLVFSFPVGRIHSQAAQVTALLSKVICPIGYVQEGQLCTACRLRSSCLLGRCHGVPRCLDPRAGRQCCQGQQEDKDNSQALAAGYQVQVLPDQRCHLHLTVQERRGAKQTPRWRYHRSRRRPAQHPSCPASQEKCKFQGKGLIRVQSSELLHNTF